jgi:hypothetical protein
LSREVYIAVAALVGLLLPLLVFALVRRRAPRRIGDATDPAVVAAAFRDTGAGVAFFDAHERLVMATPRYAELLGLPPGDMVPGLPVSVLLQGAAFRGDAADAVGREATWIEETLFAHRRAGGPWLQRGRGSRWLCLSIGATPVGGRVHVVTDVSALGKVRRQVAEEVRRLAGRGAFDPVNALIGAPEPVRPLLGEVAVELQGQVDGLSSALHRLEADNDNHLTAAGAGLREAVGGLSRLRQRCASVEALGQPA